MPELAWDDRTLRRLEAEVAICLELPGDPHLPARDHPQYRSAAHAVRTAHGVHEGLGWAIVKVFAKRPKHVDPTAGPP